MRKSATLRSWTSILFVMKTRGIFNKSHTDYQQHLKDFRIWKKSIYEEKYDVFTRTSDNMGRVFLSPEASKAFWSRSTLATASALIVSGSPHTGWLTSLARLRASCSGSFGNLLRAQSTRWLLILSCTTGDLFPQRPQPTFCDSILAWFGRLPAAGWRLCTWGQRWDHLNPSTGNVHRCPSLAPHGTVYVGCKRNSPQKTCLARPTLGKPTLATTFFGHDLPWPGRLRPGPGQGQANFGHNLQLGQFGPILVGPGRFWSTDPAAPDHPPPDRPPRECPKFRAYFFLLPPPFSFFFSLWVVVFWLAGTLKCAGLSCGSSPAQDSEGEDKHIWGPDRPKHHQIPREDPELTGGMATWSSHGRCGPSRSRDSMECAWGKWGWSRRGLFCISAVATVPSGRNIQPLDLSRLVVWSWEPPSWTVTLNKLWRVAQQRWWETHNCGVEFFIWPHWFWPNRIWFVWCVCVCLCVVCALCVCVLCVVVCCVCVVLCVCVCVLCCVVLCCVVSCRVVLCCVVLCCVVCVGCVCVGCVFCVLCVVCCVLCVVCVCCVLCVVCCVLCVVCCVLCVVCCVLCVSVCVCVCLCVSVCVCVCCVCCVLLLLCVSEHLNIWTSEHLNIWTSDHLITWSPDHLNTWIPEHLNTWTPGHQDTRTLGPQTPKHLNT